MTDTAKKKRGRPAPRRIIKPHGQTTGFALIVTPLTSFGDPDENLAFVGGLMLELIDEGLVPLCPHLMALNTGFEGPGDERGRQKALLMIGMLSAYQKTLIPMGVHVWGPTDGRGVMEEVAHARLYSVPVHFRGYGPWARAAHKAGLPEEQTPI